MQNIDILTKFIFFPFWICNFTVQWFLILCSSQNYSDYKIISLYFFSHLFERLCFFFHWEVADHPSENVKFSITGCFLCHVSPQIMVTTLPVFPNLSPPSPHADPFPCLQAALFFSPGWRWTDATKWMLHNWLGSKGGWNSLWKWNRTHAPEMFGTTASQPEHAAPDTSKQVFYTFNSLDKPPALSAPVTPLAAAELGREAPSRMWLGL